MSAGNRVLFDDDGSFFEDKRTGERMWMREDKIRYEVPVRPREVTALSEEVRDVEEKEGEGEADEEDQ
jgi:hydroxyacyl-ACP dehydratase HTD2-like protein with hotdog domain